MSMNFAPESTTTHNADQQHQHLHDVHEHLRHAATSDAPEEIRERLRREELALLRRAQTSRK